MKQKIYQIDSFARKVFQGNPAAVCILDYWPSPDQMQGIAEENNLSETAFAVAVGDHFTLRWFTPENEVDLCGHATLATAFVLKEYYGYKKKTVVFDSPRSGRLEAHFEKDGKIRLNFPLDPPIGLESLREMNEAIGLVPQRTLRGKTDFMLVYDSEETIRGLEPDFSLLNKINARGIIVTAPGDEVDFVSRFFAPKCGIPEDPVTGSAHTTMVPYWAKELGKTEFVAKQLSKRGGELWCKLDGDRVEIAGYATPYLIGEIDINSPAS